MLEEYDILTFSSRIHLDVSTSNHDSNLTFHKSVACKGRWYPIVIIGVTHYVLSIWEQKERVGILTLKVSLLMIDAFASGKTSASSREAFGLGGACRGLHNCQEDK